MLRFKICHREIAPEFLVVIISSSTCSVHRDIRDLHGRNCLALLLVHLLVIHQDQGNHGPLR